MTTPILVMAAGESARLGEPKQLLTYKDTCLVNYVIQECIDSAVGEVYVVLGAYETKIREELSGVQCTLLVHEDWKQGLGNSIAYGVRNIKDDDADGVIVVLADQPYFSRKIVLDIIQKRMETHAPIVISQYEKGKGPPTFFERSLWPELTKVKGDDGAKAIVRRYNANTVRIQFKNGSLDIDTIEDLKLLEIINNSKNIL